MQYSSVFFSILLSAAVAAQMDMNMNTGMDMNMNMNTDMDMNMNMNMKNGTLTEEQTCKEILGLDKLVKFAANQTKVDAITMNDPTKAAALQAKASAAQTKLTSLESNSTLMNNCAMIDAAIMTNSSCTQQFILQKFVDFAANDTLVTQTVNNDMTRVAAIELKASDAASKLEKLQSNATLQAACPAIFMADECKMVNVLRKFSMLVMNDTKLEKWTKGNETKVDDIKTAGMVAGMQAMMLASNATLMMECENMGIDIMDTTQKATTKESTKKSAAAVDGLSLGALFMGVLALGMAML